MSERAVFYQLSHKFVSSDKNIPDGAKQVVYYSLAIGHHVGVLDCFTTLLEIPLDALQNWLVKLPEGEGRRKLEGILRWGEVEINSHHAAAICSALEDSLVEMSPTEASWASTLIHSFQAMKVEPALYLMARKRA